MKVKLLINCKKNCYLLFLLFFVMIISSSFKTYQTRQFISIDAAINVFDSDSSFIANSSEGWELYTSWFGTENDSITIELILGRQVPTGNDWQLPTLAGTIAPEHAPVFEQSINFQEPNRNWSMIVKTDGKCFFKLIDGEPPIGNAIVLPLKTKYKRN